MTDRYSPFYSLGYILDVLEDGHFLTMFPHYANEEIRRSEDPVATKAAILKSNTVSRRSDYAKLIDPIADGMLAMAQTTDHWDVIKMIDINDNNWWVPRHAQMCGREGKAVVLINRDAPDCGCMRSEDVDLFAPSGRIGIKAILLSIDDRNPSYTQLGIVLPVRRHDDFEPWQRKSGCTVMTIDRTGNKEAVTHIPRKKDPEFMTKLLGLATPYWGADCPVPDGLRFSSGHFDDAVGFPGATDYLADQLPRLGEYFTTLAATLTGGKHKY
jgi:hypothetical protein